MNKKLFIVSLAVILLVAYGIYYFGYSMSINRLPEGEFITESKSPSGEYTIKAYLTNGGATTSYGIRGELNFNNSNKNPKNIYWDYRIEKAVIEWLDDDIVKINGIELKIPYEKFDWRREK